MASRRVINAVVAEWRAAREALGIAMNCFDTTSDSFDPAPEEAARVRLRNAEAAWRGLQADFFVGDLSFEGRARAEEVPANGDRAMPKISIYVEGEDVSVVTDARSERDFTEGFAPAFAKVVTANGKNPPGTSRAAVSAAFDIIAKLRGYKTTVQERRVLAAGRWPHPTEKAIAETLSEDTPVVEEGAPAV